MDLKDVKNDVLLDIKPSVLLEELRLLRDKNKGKYITDSFCVELENLSNKIAMVIKHKSSEEKVLQLNRYQLPEKMSNQMVELCLECIELYLQKIIDGDVLTEFETDFMEKIEKNNLQVNSEIQILAHIAFDLRALAIYIKFTLYPDNVNYKDLSDKPLVFH